MFSFPDDGGDKLHDMIGLARWTPAPPPRNQHESAGETLNYGASISTLAKMIEAGEL
jgi:hypothetical protein